MKTIEKRDRAVVALRKESVDRNVFYKAYKLFGTQSLSARRAWIEIACFVGVAQGSVVALRKESVDRNDLEPIQNAEAVRSLSARRAWIEIRCMKH